MHYITPPTVYPTLDREASPELLAYPLPQGFANADEYLSFLVRHQASSIYGDRLPQNVEERLSMELNAIKIARCADYFLIIEDLVHIARSKYKFLIGAGRASFAGSLVCYYLGITKVDPLKYGLLFERFFPDNGALLPDIDLEFENNSRDILQSYLREKYGEEYVTHIITYLHGRKPSSSIMGYGIHICGIALSKEAISQYSPLTIVQDKIVTIYDGSQIEKAGVVKLDILESDLLTQIAHTLSLIAENKGLIIDIHNIPLDDETTLEAFGRGDTDGIPGFDHSKMKETLTQLKTISFDSLIALHLLLASQNLQLYIDRDNAQTSIEYPLPCMRQCLDETHGILIYQEQLMQLSQQIASFSMAESNSLREAIKASSTKELDKFKVRFLAGGIANAHPKAILEQIWDYWLNNGQMLRLKSHWLCETLTAYQMMYLKCHYQEESLEVITRYSEEDN